MGVTLTNKLNLPQQLVDACLYDTHRVAGDISCSALIENPRIILLKRQNDYTEDISDRMYMLLGTALHNILERANIKNVQKRAFLMTYEKLVEGAKDISNPDKQAGMLKVANYLTKVIPYFFPELEDRFLYEVTQRFEIEGKVVYGTPDLFDKLTGTLYDYKFCSVFSYIYAESRQKWEAQTNVYAELLRKAGYEVNEIKIVAFFRDYSEQKFTKNKDYPTSQVMEIPIKLRSSTEMSTYIHKRIKLHNDAEETGLLPFCSGRERWATADDYAVKTPKTKKALRVFATKEEAEKFITENHHKFDEMTIDFRPGSSTKCERFCSVKDFCGQYKAELEELRKKSDEE